MALTTLEEAFKDVIREAGLKKTPFGYLKKGSSVLIYPGYDDRIALSFGPAHQPTEKASFRFDGLDAHLDYHALDPETVLSKYTAPTIIRPPYVDMLAKNVVPQLEAGDQAAYHLALEPEYVATAITQLVGYDAAAAKLMRTASEE